VAVRRPTCTGSNGAAVGHEVVGTGAPALPRPRGRAYEQHDEEGDVNQVDCECGFRARDDDEDRVVELVLEHVSAKHPDLAETVTPLVIRRWIEQVP
jgi:hypothetical protein